MTAPLEHLGRERWDAVVVGAGPAGSVCARRLAIDGWRVLLVERAVFPRWKVCGACLGAAGVATLRREGLGGVLDDLGAARIARTELVWRGRSLRVPMRGMVAVSRGALDRALASEAERAGAVFVPGVRARWDDAAGSGGGPVLVDLESDAGSTRVESRSLVIAGGLRAAPANGAGGAVVKPGSWIGIGASGSAESPAGRGVRELTMFVGTSGYAGRVVTEDGVANWAAAVDPNFLRRAGGPAASVRSICEQAGAGACPPEVGWTGTPALTRRCPAQRGCVYRVGDAAGYVEPITGEGMSWAMLGGAALAPVLGAALRSGRHRDAWASRHGRLLAVRRARCGLVARSLRSPVAMSAAFSLFGSAGLAGTAVVNRLIGASPRTERA